MKIKLYNIDNNNIINSLRNITYMPRIGEKIKIGDSEGIITYLVKDIVSWIELNELRIYVSIINKRI